ncbi:MAG: radical SAM/SPASM domain-containing protein [Phycisphaerae bacterium]|jgi:radical SAM protein with 4Fe4S-binding SPASM domain
MAPFTCLPETLLQRGPSAAPPTDHARDLVQLVDDIQSLCRRPGEPETPTDAEAAAHRLPEYRRALEQLAAGKLQQGAQALGDIARHTSSRDVRELCLFRLGEVLHQLGQTEEAYNLWYSLAHGWLTPPTWTRITARCRVNQAFDQAGLLLRPPEFPPRVQIEVTNRCNLRCVMCTRNQMHRPLTDLPLEYLRKIADECSTQPGSGIMLFFLGEPLLHAELEEMVRYIVSLRDRSPLPSSFAIQTNGMLLDRDRSRRLLEAGLREFYISLDALEGDLERIRRGAKYEVIERNILDLLDVRRELGFTEARVHISKLCDDPQAPEVQRFGKRWVALVDTIFLNGISKVPGNAYMTADGQIRTVPFDAGPAHYAYCRQGQRLLVLANGDYGFCHGDINGQFNLGNVRDRSIREVWNSPEISAIRRKVVGGDMAKLGPCRNCPIIPT